MEPQDQLNLSPVSNPAPTPTPPPPPPPVAPAPVYSATATTAPASGGGLMSVVLGVVIVAVIGGGVWWWMSGGMPYFTNSSNGNPSGDGSYANPFGSGFEPGAGGNVSQNGGGTGAGAQSCSSFFSKEISTREFYDTNDLDVPQGMEAFGTFKPTASVSAKFAAAVQIPSGLKVVSKLVPEEGSQWGVAEVYIFCSNDMNSVISFYNSYFGNTSKWHLTRMVSNGQGALRESLAAISKTSPVSLYFGVSNPNDFINQPAVTMTATYAQ